MELIIKGDERKVKRLAKEIKLRLKRDGLEVSFKESRKLAKPKVSETPKNKPTEREATSSKKDSK